MDPTRRLDDAQKLARWLKKTWTLPGVNASLWIERVTYDRPGTAAVHHHYIRSNFDPMTGKLNDVVPSPEAAVFPV